MASPAPGPSPEKVLISLATFNEVENLRPLILAIRDLSARPAAE